MTVGAVSGRGRTEIDARGRYVSPGWIDMMDQSGSVLPRNPLAENKLRMGVTTALIYPPSSYATADELVEVARVAGRHGGFYASHIRGEGEDVVAAVREAIEVGERGGLPVEIFHLKVAHRPGWGRLMAEVRDTIEAARARGLDVAADMYVYTAGGTGLEATIPSWAQWARRTSRPPFAFRGRASGATPVPP